MSYVVPADRAGHLLDPDVVARRDQLSRGGGDQDSL